MTVIYVVLAIAAIGLAITSIIYGEWLLLVLNIITACIWAALALWWHKKKDKRK